MVGRKASGDKAGMFSAKDEIVARAGGPGARRACARPGPWLSPGQSGGGVGALLGGECVERRRFLLLRLRLPRLARVILAASSASISQKNKTETSRTPVQSLDPTISM